MAKILKITDDAIHDICEEEKQKDFNKTLIKYLESLTEERSEDEKMRFAKSLVQSYKMEDMQFNEEPSNEN